MALEAVRISASYSGSAYSLMKRAHGCWQFRHRSFDLLDPRIGNDQRWQVRVREVAVILRVFLAAHFAGFLAVRIVQTGGLHHGAAVFDQFDLAAHFT
jgi:hypothetical protein